MARRKKKRQTLSFTFKGKPLLSFFFTPSKNGYIFGVSEPKKRDVHLTIVDEENRLGWHITDKTKEKEPNPIDFHIGKEALVQTIGNELLKMVVEYHGNRKMWVMTPSLSKKFNAMVLESYGKSYETPLELLLGELECDFESEDRWMRVRIKDYVGKSQFGLIEEDDQLKIIVPIEKKLMFCATIEEFQDFALMIFRYLGGDFYFEHIDLESILSEKIKQIVAG
ncbi:MAG: hypothetical protein ACTSPB_04000, partial [Candidatus Thorarchaeota archaeon]